MTMSVESLPSEPVIIKDSPLGSLPDPSPLSSSQWRTLLALADTIVPAVVESTKPSTPFKALALEPPRYRQVTATIDKYALESQHTDKTDDLTLQYLAERPSKLPRFKEAIWRFLAFSMAPQDLRKVTMILNLLDYRASSFLLTGSAAAFADQPVAVRESIVQSWSKARIPVYRGLYKSLTALVKVNWVKVSPTLFPLLNLPRVPVHGKPSPSFPFEFIQIPPGDDVEVLETDVVIVGSGCGSGPMAKKLAEAGHRVTVVEKGYHWPSEHLPMTEEQGWQHLFENTGAISSDDSSIAVVAGSTWGGGGTVNWSASLQTQGYVRKEWATVDNLPFFTSADFQSCLDEVCDRMGVSTSAILHNKSNAIILEGARKLGWSAKAVPQNTGGSQHYCGSCSFGCGSCVKQGPTVAWLPDAAKAGATFMEGFDVQKVLFEQKDGKKVAVGVQGLFTSRDEHAGVVGTPLVKRKVIIKAKRVIVAAGTLQSPLLLMRSGLKNKWIGRNLRLHPVSFLVSVYDEEVRPWEGGILTAVVNEFENQDGKGHGTKIEAATMVPTTLLAFAPWSSGVDYKLLAPKLKNMVGHFAMARDSAGGSVYPDPEDGRPRVIYTTDKRDREYLIDGTIAAAKLNYIMGAREIFTTIPNTSTYVRPFGQEESAGVNDAAFNKWLEEVRKRGLPHPDTVFVSAHQMGTNRMSATPSKGVVNPVGKVWEAEGLYVADASVFPSASGVNPMVTNMAISEWIARNLVKDLATGGASQAKL